MCGTHFVLWGLKRVLRECVLVTGDSHVEDLSVRVRGQSALLTAVCAEMSILSFFIQIFRV